MTEPLRLTILKRITDMLSTDITVANGYNNTLTGAVYRGRQVFNDETDPLPCVSILEAPILEPAIEYTGDSYGMSGTWRLFIQGWARDDIENPTDPAHILMYDVKRCLRQMVDRNNTSRYLLGKRADGRQPLIRKADVGFGLVRPPTPNVSSRAFFYLPIDLGVVETADDL